MSVAFASLSGFLGGLSGAVTQQGMLDSALPHGRSRAPSRAASRALQTPHRLRSFAGVEAASVRPSRAPSYAPAAQSALPSRAPSGLPLSELSYDASLQTASEGEGAHAHHLDLAHRAGGAPQALLAEYDRLVALTLRAEHKSYSEEEKEELRAAIAQVKFEIVRATNRWNSALSAVAGVHGVYVSLVSSMLLLFVPQTCHDASGGSPHACAMGEVFHNLTNFGTFVFALNLATLALALGTEAVMLSREAWLDRALVVDASVPPNNLSAPQLGDADGRSLLQQEPYMARRLLRLNHVAGAMARASSVVMLANWICSAEYLLRPRHTEGFRSVTTLLTNGMLLLPQHMRTAVVCLAAATNHGRGGEGTRRVAPILLELR